MTELGIEPNWEGPRKINQKRRWEHFYAQRQVFRSSILPVLIPLLITIVVEFVNVC